MKRVVLLIQLCLTCYAASASGGFFMRNSREEHEKLLATLDSLLAQKDYFVDAKEERILQMKKQRAKAHSNEEVYLMNKLIYEEYRVYNADSALYYINKNKVLAQKAGNPEWLATAQIDQSFVLSATGLLKEALEVVSDIQAENLPRRLRSKYYGQMRSLYSRMRDYSNGNPGLSQFYNNLQQLYSDSIRQFSTPDEPRYLYAMDWQLIGTPAITPYKEALKKRITSASPDTRNYAMMCYNLAAIHKSEKNEDSYLKYLILSAMADIRSANRDIGSLPELAEYLFRNGEIDRPYMYVNYCSQNAQMYRNRVRLIAASKLQSAIHQAYQERNRKQQERLRLFLITVSLLSVILIGAFLFIRRQMRNLAESGRKLDEANKSLNKHMQKLSDAHQRLEEANNRLQELNNQLQEVNAQLRESNYVKEEYIGYVFNLCSTYISKQEEFRKSINRKLKVGQIEDVKNITDSSTMAASELKEFYHNFDTIFLHLYPDFVEDFNALLVPEERIEPKEGELLNTELRIHALIRLGITDSVKIADFLHCSAQTIYNNRLRTRNKSAIPKEEFINAVKKLGKYKE